jgi:hypothetical protein
VSGVDQPDERLTDGGGRLIAIAPHGGDIVWGSRSQPEPVTCGYRQPGMIAHVSPRLLYLIFSRLLSWLTRRHLQQPGRLRPPATASIGVPMTSRPSWTCTTDSVM